MSQPVINNSIRWTTSDLELLPDSSNRYEIIDGVLLVTEHRIGDTKKQLPIPPQNLEIGR